MTLMSSISKLTISVDQLTGETNVTKSQLDAKVSQADAEIISTQAELAATEGYLGEAAANATDAATHLATVKADVTYQGISAILAEKAATAVDVFVYDTSLDSDGGAWRRRCQHTSWYNENLNTATRGSRREFPAVAVIVAEAAKVTIYDGDDPALPMWMVFDVGSDKFFNTAGGGAITAATMQNGWLVGSSSSRSISRANFISEEAYIGVGGGSYKLSVLIAKFRNAVAFPAYSGPPSMFVLAHPSANDVAITVLPNAPVDPATSLPIPTIAVATAGGVSVIKDSGTVVDITASVYTMNAGSIAFFGDRLLIGQDSSTAASRVVNVHKIPYGDEVWAGADYNSQAADERYIWYPGGAWSGDLAFPKTAFGNIGKGAIPYGDMLAARALGLGLVSRKPDSPENGMAAFISTQHNTGWMPGKIKLAALAGIDQTVLVSSEQITNGTFDTDMTGWVSGSGDADYAEVIDGALRVYGNAYIYQAVPTVMGQTYRAQFEIIGGTGGVADFRIGYGPNGTQLYDHPANVGVGVYETYFTATGPTTYITLKTHFQPGALSDFMDFDNISVRPGVPDRSVNNSGFTVHGTVRREAVADGAELASYGNMVTNVDFLGKDFKGSLSGASTFAMVFWAKGNPSSQVFGWHEALGSGTSAQFFNLYFDGTTGQPRFIWQGRRSLNAGGDCPPHNGQWALHVAIFEGGDFRHYQDGKFMSQYLNHGIVSDLHELRIHPVGTASLSLFRITETIPAPDQIAKIYEDERKLFQPGAKCTLFGTSDAVTALAHDPKTNLLHVGTSAGRSTFDGLQRVANTETPVTTAISAVNGLIAEQ
ncbi:MAG: hypothetical protein QGI08_04275 [Paracoccaceae bacterium]|jgi:hypothetical protein|nr:hypothetical protein [Paracoccaceae bacterium]